MGDGKIKVSEQAVEALANALRDRLVAVVLFFRSRARGDAKAWSDWNFLVIADEVRKKGTGCFNFDSAA